MSAPEETPTPTPVAAIAPEEEKPVAKEEETPEEEEETVISLVSPDTEQRLKQLREFNGGFFAFCQLPNKNYDNDVRDSGNLTQLALEGDKCVGAITCRRDKDKHGNVAKVYIKSIAVLESHRRRGIGTMLLERVIDLCYQEGIPELYLKVENDNESAIKFYEKFEFKTTGADSSNKFKIMALVPEAQTIGISDSDE